MIAAPGPVRAFFGATLPERVSGLVVAVSSTIQARIQEARATLPLDVYLTLASLNGGRHLIEHPKAFKDGWALMAVGLSQPAFGWILVAAGLGRAAAIYSGRVEWRERTASLHFVIVGVSLYMIQAANGDSPVLPNAQLALLSDGWIIGSAEWAKVERRRRAGAPS